MAGSAKNERGLTIRQEKFVAEYLRNGYNAANAYRDAYQKDKYSNNVLRVRGSEVLRKPQVQAAIAAYESEIKERALTSIDDIELGLQEVVALAKEKGDLTNMRSGYMDIARLRGLVEEKKRVTHVDNTLSAQQEKIAMDFAKRFQEGESVH